MKRVRPHRLANHVESLGLWLALGMLVTVAGLVVGSTTALVDNAAWVDHTHRVIESLDDVTTSISRAVNSRRGFSITGDTEYLDSYARATREIADAERSVRTLTSDNPTQQHRLDGLEPLLATSIARLDAGLEYRRTHGFEADREAKETKEGTIAFNELQERVADLATEERLLLGAREQRTAETVVRTETIEAIGGCIGLALIVAVVVRLRREMRRREESERTGRESEQAIKRLNDDLGRRVEERTAQLKMANDELESFSYSVVHNLRAPLRGMGGFAEVLLNECEDTLSVDARDCLREIRQNAQKMAAIIDALLSMSRITRGEVTRLSVDLSGLARTVADRLAAAEPGAIPAVEVQENLRAEVDPPLALTLVEILLGNSWKFTGKVASARIDFGATDIDGERVLFVRDNGAGFDMAHADKLFAPFGRLHTVAEFPGIGIGLATAHRIVRRHGGRIWADGHVGHGAAVYFTLGPKWARETT